MRKYQFILIIIAAFIGFWAVVFTLASVVSNPEPNEVEAVFCDVCGESLTEWNFDGSRETVIGLYWNFAHDHKEFRRAKKVFGKNEINVCYVCFLKALGVKPIEEK